MEFPFTFLAKPNAARIGDVGYLAVSLYKRAGTLQDRCMRVEALSLKLPVMTSFFPAVLLCCSRYKP
jgi:hypothetical protein